MIKVSSDKLLKIMIGLCIVTAQVAVAHFIVKHYLKPGRAEEVAAERGREKKEKVRNVSRDTAEGDGREKKKPANRTDSIGEIYLVKDIVVNPAGTGGRRYVSMDLALEIGSAATATELQQKEPVIRDLVIRLLLQKRIEDLDGREDADRLKYQIVRALALKLGEDKVANVYLSNFVLQ